MEKRFMIVAENSMGLKEVVYECVCGVNENEDNITALRRKMTEDEFWPDGVPLDCKNFVLHEIKETSELPNLSYYALLVPRTHTQNDPD